MNSKLARSSSMKCIDCLCLLVLLQQAVARSSSMKCTVFLCLLVLLQQAVAQVPPDEPDPNRRPNVTYYNTGKTTALSPFYANLLNMITFFRGHNPPNGYTTCLGYGDEIVYGHSSCYNMSDQPTCGNCVQRAFDTIQKANQYALGGVLWINSSSPDVGYRCRLRYENYNFTDEVIARGALGVIGPNNSVPVPPPETQPSNSSPPSKTRSKFPKGAIGGIVGGAVLVGIIAGFFVWKWRNKYTKLDGPNHRGARDELDGSIEGPLVFKYQELSQATSNFSNANKLGQGGFGAVYKACLCDGTVVAVKKLSLQSHQGRPEFVNEISIITSIKHRNLVTLKGYCIEGDERLLVFEFMENGSLDRALFGNTIEAKPWLTWQSRLDIALGVARGLAYLHEESPVQIIHRDIKASNILLDKKLQPKISDFGISKLFDVEKGFTSTNIAGTVGYMAPEYANRGKLTSKADVFGYGILVLEIISGRRCADSTLPSGEEILVQHIWKLCQAEKVDESVDKRLGNDYVSEDLVRLIRVAMVCTQDDETARPTMGSVVAMLQGYLEIPHVPDEPPGYFAKDLLKRSRDTSESIISGSNIITQPTAR